MKVVQAQKPGRVPSAAEYVNDWLDDTSSDMDFGWTEACIEKGFFLICPRCYFLHMPQISWWMGVNDDAPTAGGCDVCVIVATMDLADVDLQREGVPEEEPALGWEQAPQLRKMRTARAWLLYQLWWQGCQAAQDWAGTMTKAAWAKMQKEAADDAFRAAPDTKKT